MNPILHQNKSRLNALSHIACALSDIIKLAVELSISEEIDEGMNEEIHSKETSNLSCLNKIARNM